MSDRPIVVLIAHHFDDTDKAETLKKTLETTLGYPALTSSDLAEALAASDQASLKNELRYTTNVLLLLTSQYLKEPELGETDIETLEELARGEADPSDPSSDSSPSPVCVTVLRMTAKDIPEDLRRYPVIDFFRQPLTVRDERQLTEKACWFELRTMLSETRDFSLPAPVIGEELHTVFNSGKAILYVGYQLAELTGFASRSQQLHALIGMAAKFGELDEEYRGSLYSSLENHEEGIVAETLADLLEKAELTRKSGDFLAAEFTSEQAIILRRSAASALALSRLLRDYSYSFVLTPANAPAALVLPALTTKEHPAFSYAQSKQALTRYSARQGFSMHLYGAYESEETIFISEHQFKNYARRQDPALSELLQTAFLSRPFIFVGATLVEINDFCEALEIQSPSQRHYAIAPIREATYTTRAGALSLRYNIEVIPYLAWNSTASLIDISAQLAAGQEKRADAEKDPETVKGDRLPKDGAPGPTIPTFMARLQLTNIGPFADLDLELRRDWNILLGDNGMGKSTILKAIATLMAGTEAAPFAERLIKWDADSATIRLTSSGGEVYEASLRRKLDGGASIQMTTSNPMFNEGWLTLGFPPLRDLSWQQLGTPETVTGASRPSTEDVLPLASDIPDPRMDKLKEWIYNLDYRARSKGDGRGSARKQFDKLFEIINALTEGVAIGFKEIDVDRGRILLETDDGIIPLEAISQGMVSLLGWIGVLMQRLYDINPDLEDLNEANAIVLIDEIDAHMHPRWQQALIKNLSAHFRNVQFIATSHSPLIVGGLAQGRVHFLDRAEDTKLVQHRTLDEPFIGWSVAQIVTHPFFGLPGSRDLDTVNAVDLYTDLVLKDARTPEEETKLAQLANQLQLRPPSEHEREEARKAYALIEDYAQQQLAALSDQDKETLRRELEAQVQEGITGSARPS